MWWLTQSAKKQFRFSYIEYGIQQDIENKYKEIPLDKNTFVNNDPYGFNLDKIVKKKITVEEIHPTFATIVNTLPYEVFLQFCKDNGIIQIEIDREGNDA